MKTTVLFMAMMLLGLAPATATTVSSPGEDARYRYAQPIMFVERGIEFMIFPDGSFDFNTNMEHAYHNANSYYYRSTTRRSNAVNTTFGAPGSVSRVQYSRPRSQSYYPTTGVLVQHDNDGKVRRIGNVYINYDRRGRIKRAGTVYMSYQRGNRGYLRQVGGLRVNYNRWGEIVHISGTVNHGNSHYTYATGSQTTGQVGYGHYDDYEDTDDYYYYRKGDTVKKQKKLKR